MLDRVVLDPYGRKRDLIFTPSDLSRLEGIADLVWGRDELMPESEIEACREDVVAIICGRWHYGDVSRFPRLRGILEVSGGFPSSNALDYTHCFAKHIRVLSCAPAFAPAVAEMGLAMALANCRQVVETAEAFRVGTENWSHEEFRGTFLLHHKPVGFIGYGNIGRHLKGLLEPFHCSIQVCDPWLTDTYLTTQGLIPADLETLMATSRFIFVLATPTASNKALLTRELLALVPADAVFLLLSRAHVVDFDALTEMVLEGRFRAAIDVFPQEPLAPDHPLRKAPRVILSSHRAGAHAEALHNIGRIVVNDLEAILKGLAPQEMQSASPEYIRLRS